MSVDWKCSPWASTYDRFVISYVRPDSPADQAGILVGDQIISINGIDVEGSKIDQLYGTLLKRRGRILTLKTSPKRGCHCESEVQVDLRDLRPAVLTDTEEDVFLASS